MAKKSTELFHWRIYYIKAIPAQFIGSVDAPDEETAREVATVLYGVSKEKVEQLLAVKVAPAS